MLVSRNLTRADVFAAMFCVIFLAMNVFAVTALQREIQNRVICGTNLKGLGTAQAVYANDYEDQYARQGGSGNAVWSEKTDGWDDPTKDWNQPGDVRVTVGASLYLLVREADVQPKSFVCAGGMQVPYQGQNDNPMNPELWELWDFGSIDYQDTGPRNCVSYSYHLPYSRHAASGAASASFAVMADKNPWMDHVIFSGETTATDWKERVGLMGAYFEIGSTVADWEIRRANTYSHGREGQNVTYGDGHSSYEKVTDVGVRHDGIYTIQESDYTSEVSVRIGHLPDPLGIGYGLPKRTGDSFLVNDDEINPCSADQPADLNDDCTVDIGDLAIVTEHWMESTREE